MEQQTMKKFLIILLAIVIVGSTGGFLYMKSQENGNEFDFRTAEVERSDISDAVIATGKIEPKARVEIKSKIGGIVTKFHVEEGDRVTAGQILAEIIPGSTPIELVRTRNEVKNAAYTRDNARKLYDRASKLLKEKMMSEQDFYTIKTQFETANTQFYSAMAQLKVLESGSEASGIESELNLSADDIERIEREASEALYSMRLISPIGGIVLSRDTDEGTTVTPISSAQGGTVVMVLADVGHVLFKGDVDEADIGKVQVNTPVRIHVEAYLEKTFEGTLYKISPLGREKNNVVNFEVEAEVLDPDKLLRVGMSADAEIVLKENLNALVIPEGTINYDENETYVYLFDSLAVDGKKRVDIEVGISDGIITEVLSGLTEGQEVIFKN